MATASNGRSEKDFARDLGLLDSLLRETSLNIARQESHLERILGGQAVSSVIPATEWLEGAQDRLSAFKERIDELGNDAGWFVNSVATNLADFSDYSDALEMISFEGERKPASRRRKSSSAKTRNAPKNKSVRDRNVERAQGWKQAAKEAGNQAANVPGKSKSLAGRMAAARAQAGRFGKGLSVKTENAGMLAMHIAEAYYKIMKSVRMDPDITLKSVTGENNADSAGIMAEGYGPWAFTRKPVPLDGPVMLELPRTPAKNEPNVEIKNVTISPQAQDAAELGRAISRCVVETINSAKGQ